MEYVIIANPVAGKLSKDEKERILDKASEILGCEYDGLETKTPKEFRDCVKYWAKRADHIIGAGGDGTVADVINSVKPRFPVSFLPFGSGKGLHKTLGLPKSVIRTAKQIKNGKERSLDLILCDNNKKALFVDIGIGGHIEKRRQKYVKKGVKGFGSYSLAVIETLIKPYKRPDATITVDGKSFVLPKMMYLLITKVSSQGYGLKITPEAEVDDGYLHLRYFNFGKLRAFYFFASSLLFKKKIGGYITGKHIQIDTTTKQNLTINSILEKVGTHFELKVLEGGLKTIY